MAGGFVLLGRQNNTAGLPGSAKPAVSLDVDAIHTRFRGLEGEPWPNRPATLHQHLNGGFLLPKSLAPGRKYYEMVAAQCLCDFLFIEPFTHMGGETELPREFVLLGFDFGRYFATEDYTISSSQIYSNILFGEHDELREMASDLNEYLLFSDHRILKLFGRALTRLLATKDSEMAESSIGQGFTIYGLPKELRKVNPRYYEPPSFIA